MFHAFLFLSSNFQERNLVGTLVTSESFAAWNAAFMREVEAARESYLAAERALKKGRLTGVSSLIVP